MTDAVLTEVRGRTLIITLNRPEARNAIDHAVADGLLAAVAQLHSSDELTVGVLTGAGRGFCAGLDLKAFARSGTPTQLLRFLRDGTTKPLITAIEGFALGGGLELALAGDILVAGTGARFGFPEVRVGLFAAGGGVLRVGRYLPQGEAMALVLTGEPISAEEAHRVGLVTRVAADGEALDRAVELAAQVARNAPLALAASKSLVRLSAGRDEAELWNLQKPFAREVFGSADAKEGARAFAEKRDPQWTGH